MPSSDAPPERGPAPARRRRAYVRTAVAVVALVGARWALTDDGATPAGEERATEVDGAVAPELVDVPVPAPFVPRPDDAATQDAGPSIFEDVSERSGVDAPHRAARLEAMSLPAGQVASLVGSADPSPEELRSWSAENLSPYLGAVTTLRHYGTGQAWGDHDGDGDPDLYLTDQDGPNQLLRNDGDGTFSPSPYADQVALPDQVSGGAVFVDADGDGWLDLHVVGDGPDALFRNLEGTGFEDVSESSGLIDPGQGETATWGDIDGDGLLDVYVVNYGCQPCNDAPPVPLEQRDQDRLFRNLGDGRFEDVTGWIDDIAATRGLGFAAQWFDYDRDGRLDLYVVNDVRDDRADAETEAGVERGDGSTPGNVLIRNEGPGCGGWCFRDVTEEAGAGARANAMGLAVGDHDGNGALDLFFTNSGWAAGPTRLLANQGDGTFEDVSAATGTNLGEWSWGTNFLDADGDGRLDLYVAVGLSELAMQAAASELPDDTATADAVALRQQLRDGERRAVGSLEPPAWAVAPTTSPRTDNDRILLQTDDGRFEEVVLGPTDAFAGVTFGSAVADFDGDGRPDVVVGDLDRGYRLLRNRGEVGADNGVLAIELRGDGERVDRQAVGAIVELTTADGRRQLRHVAIGGSLGSGDDTLLLFGLGDAPAASAQVHWLDGTVTTVDDLQAGSRYVVTSDGAAPEATPLARA